MSSHAFTLILDGVDIMDDAVLDALYESGFGDATFGVKAGVPYAALEREAPSFSEALLETIGALETSVPNLRVVRVEPDELVNAADIAERVHRSRESVRLLAEGRRGSGDFPSPAILLHGSQPLWHWSEVAAWFHRYKGFDKGAVEQADFLAALNGALEVRRHIPRLVDPQERSVVARIATSLP